MAVVRRDLPARRTAATPWPPSARCFWTPRGTLVASSDPEHLIATIGCEDLIIVHTPDATLVCRADRAEAIKELHRLVAERFGDEYL